MSVGKLVRQGLSFSNVVPTGIATNNVTAGRTIETIQLRLGGTTFTKAMISMVRVRANGRVLVEATGTELDRISAYRGVPNGANFLDIPFFDERMTTYLDRAVSAFDTSEGVGQITTEVQIAGATAPTLTPIVVESAGQRDMLTGAPAPYAKMVGKILRYPYSVSTGGQLSFQVPFGAESGAIIKRLHVSHANMTAAVVKQDGMAIHESVAAENQNMQTSRGRVPQAGMYTIDFVVDGNIRNAFDTRDARSVEWLFTFSAADTGFILVEYLDDFENL